MSIRKILNSLEHSWERDDILLKIKSGLEPDEIVDEFFLNNEVQLNELNSLLRREDIDFLNQVEKLSTCEAKLINKINNLHHLKNKDDYQTINDRQFTFSKRISSNKISLFMINWSNKFVVIALLAISAIALSKQAWS